MVKRDAFGRTELKSYLLLFLCEVISFIGSMKQTEPIMLVHLYRLKSSIIPKMTAEPPYFWAHLFRIFYYYFLSFFLPPPVTGPAHESDHDTISARLICINLWPSCGMTNSGDLVPLAVTVTDRWNILGGGMEEE